MSILFTIPPKYQKYKKPVSIYVRISDTIKFQLFASSGFKVKPRYWNFDPKAKEKLKKNFKPVPLTKAEKEKKLRVLSNNVLDELKIHISNKFEIAKANRDTYPVIDSKWLKDVIQEFRGEVRHLDENIFVNFFQGYIKRKSKDTFNPILERVREFGEIKGRQYRIIEINSDWAAGYVSWLISLKYTPGYINQELSHIKRVVKDAKKNNHDISELDLSDWKTLKDIEKTKLGVVYLNDDEVDKVFNCDVSDSPMLDNMKNILLVSCYTGLRYSDVHKVRLEAVINNKIEVHIQKKSSEKITVPIHPRVKTLLLKKPIKKISNTHFNDHIGKLIKKAGINEPVTNAKRRIEKIGGKDRRVRAVITAPKYEFVTSHTGRRSFCSNFYGKIPTPLLMKLSGHSSETNLLRYIGKTSDDAADIFLEKFGQDEKI